MYFLVNPFGNKKKNQEKQQNQSAVTLLAIFSFDGF